MENKIIRIIESRGVAAIPWIDVIDKIVGYTQKTIKELYLQNKKNQYEIIIPENLSSQLTFLYKPLIKVSATYFLFPSDLPLGITQNQEDKEVNIINNNIDGIEIIISVTYDIHGNIRIKNFKSTLIHEINHAFEIFCRFKKYGNIDKMIDSNDKWTEINFNNQILNDILYYLICETEFNALIAQFYGELSELNSDRENFHTDIKKTDSYQIYQNILKNYNNVIDSLNNDEIFKLQNHCIKTKIFHYKYFKNDDSFKNIFKNKVKHLLDVLMKNYGRAAGLYYYEKENSNKTTPKQKFKFGK